MTFPERPLKLSIIMPCYNERRTIAAIVEKVLSVDTGLERELVIVDDGSTDGTREYLQTLAACPEIKVIFQPENRGKGFALRTGFSAASGDILLSRTPTWSTTRASTPS